MNKLIVLIMFIIIFFSGCKKNEISKNIDTIDNPEIHQEIKQGTEIVSQEFEEIPPLGKFRGIQDMEAPNGKILRVYNNEVMETPWRPIYSPVIYLYDQNKKVLAKYNTNFLISDDFWPGNIKITYNTERNSFDMIFSLDVYGNYGTGYIDLYTNEYIRELICIEPTEEEILEKERQNQGPEGYEEGSTLRKIDPTIFSLDPNNVSN